MQMFRLFHKNIDELRIEEINSMMAHCIQTIRHLERIKEILDRRLRGKADEKDNQQVKLYLQIVIDLLEGTSDEGKKALRDALKGE